MTIECLDVADIPYELNPDDQFQISFDISTWLGSDTIASVAYTAYDEDGTDVSTTVLDADSHENTTTVIQPYIKGGLDAEIYKIKMLVTTAGGDIKAFYARFITLEKAA